MEGRDGPGRILFEEALEGSRAAGDTYMIARCLSHLASLALRAGDFEPAAVNFRESLERFSSIGDTHDLVSTMALSAEAVIGLGDTSASAKLCGAAEALARSHGYTLEPPERRALDETTAAARQQLGDAFEEAWAAGAELELDAAVELALGWLDAHG
jgi:hypothetical protein